MIEDVEYLLENCEKDSIPFFVDSSRRNKIYHPTPSEYQVSFPMPFRLVTGFDILDATIPTTMYNVDLYNDTISLSVLRKYTRASADISEYEYFRELSQSTIFSTIFEEKVPNNRLIIVYPEDMDPQVIADELRLDNDYPGALGYTQFIATRETMQNIPFAIYISNEDPMVYYIDYDNRKYGIYRSPANQPIIDILEDKNYHINRDETGAFHIIYFKFYRSTTSIIDNLIENLEGPEQGLKVISRITNYYQTIERGNYDITLFRQYLYEQWKNVGIKVEATTAVDRKQGKLKFSSEELVIFNGNKSTVRTNLGFETLPRNDESDLYSYVNVRDNLYVFVSNQRDAITNNWVLYPPGLCNLLGERYVILRCKEIEDHLLGSYAYMNYTPGIGMFKLAAVNDITNLRFDFVSLIRKPFHPIGKVSKLTFRFETANGLLYDFKGVNHQILFMMKMLVPAQKMKFERSVLNPNYDPDFVRYINNNKTVQYKEGSDDEEQFDNRRYYEMYKREMEKYDYSTSDSEGYDSSDSEEPVQVSEARRI